VQAAKQLKRQEKAAVNAETRVRGLEVGALVVGSIRRRLLFFRKLFRGWR
jgi:hypothetical protein